ncbi:MAG: DUF2530 domain-containing protein [Ornithinimicrobium sp.]
MSEPTPGKPMPGKPTPGEPMPGKATPGEPAPEHEIVPITLPIRSLLIVRIGLGLWVIALVAVWTIPALSAGDRDWWRWVPVAALVIGLLGHTYVLRGRGNAAEA